MFPPLQWNCKYVRLMFTIFSPSYLNNNLLKKRERERERERNTEDFTLQTKRSIWTKTIFILSPLAWKFKQARYIEKWAICTERQNHKAHLAVYIMSYKKMNKKKIPAHKTLLSKLFDINNEVRNPPIHNLVTIN